MFQPPGAIILPEVREARLNLGFSGCDFGGKNAYGQGLVLITGSSGTDTWDMGQEETEAAGSEQAASVLSHGGPSKAGSSAKAGSDEMQPQQGEALSDEFMIYLCNQVSSTAASGRSRVEQRRANLLTVMSFCFIGLVTLVAASASDLKDNFPASFFAFLSFALWIIAFSLTLVRYRWAGYHVYPGYDDGFEFLPKLEESREFRQNDDDPYAADTFFMRRILARIEGCGGSSFDGLTDNELLLRYRKLVRDTGASNSFDREAWFASLSMMLRGQIKYNNMYLRFSTRIQAVLIASIACIAVSMALIWWGSEVSGFLLGALLICAVSVYPVLLIPCCILFCLAF